MVRATSRRPESAAAGYSSDARSALSLDHSGGRQRVSRRERRDAAAATPAFTQVPPRTPGAGRWQLAGPAQPPYRGALGPLVAAAHAVLGVQAVRWSGKRRAPMARDESLVDILRAVLQAAGGSLEVAQLTAVLVRRFPAAVVKQEPVQDGGRNEPR
jgi:hypothetical protein